MFLSALYRCHKEGFHRVSLSQAAVREKEITFPTGGECMKRRQVLRNLSVAAAVPVLSGCLDDPTSGANTTSTASTGTTTATQSPTRQPPRGLEGVKESPRNPPETDVECGGEALEYVKPKSGPHVQGDSGLELTASEETIAIGDEITFSLRNVSGEPVKVGNIHKDNIKRQTDQG